MAPNSPPQEFPLRSFQDWKALAVATYNEWTWDDAPRLGAALAFYTVLSLAPLLVVMIAIAGWALGREATMGQLMGQVQWMVGRDGAKAIEEMVKSASDRQAGIIASLLGTATLLIGATSVVAELRNAMNRIWKVPVDPDESWLTVITKRSSMIGFVLASGFLLLVSLLLSAWLSMAGKFLEAMLPAPEIVFQTANLVASLAVMSGLFAIMFRYLPEASVQWQDVRLGAVLTAVLFTIGKSLIGLYLGRASFGSTYGAAGSLVIVLVWVYYSAQIFFFGAEFTHVYAKRHGSRAGLGVAA
ncbi:MAG: YihY/virulence factor BrkB family protein [Bryobacteraceae bacterium]